MEEDDKPIIKEFFPSFSKKDDNYDLDLLVKSIGVSSFLIPYLKRSQPATQKSQLLLKKLEKYNEGMYPLIGLRPMGNLQIKKRYLESCLRKLSMQDTS